SGRVGRRKSPARRIVKPAFAGRRNDLGRFRATDSICSALRKMAMRTPRACVRAFALLARNIVIPGRKTMNPSARKCVCRRSRLFAAGRWARPMTI
ncbi:MAG: hypothetical protein ABR863_01490, partial [Roseiarcus sp.]